MNLQKMETKIVDAVPFRGILETANREGRLRRCCTRLHPLWHGKLFNVIIGPLDDHSEALCVQLSFACMRQTKETCSYSSRRHRRVLLSSFSFNLAKDFLRKRVDHYQSSVEGVTW